LGELLIRKWEMPEQNHCIETEAAITPAAAQQFERAVAA
jgi:hypothetical protein